MDCKNCDFRLWTLFVLASSLILISFPSKRTTFLSNSARCNQNGFHRSIPPVYLGLHTSPSNGIILKTFENNGMILLWCSLIDCCVIAAGRGVSMHYLKQPTRHGRFAFFKGWRNFAEGTKKASLVHRCLHPNLSGIPGCKHWQRGLMNLWLN